MRGDRLRLLITGKGSAAQSSGVSSPWSWATPSPAVSIAAVIRAASSFTNTPTVNTARGRSASIERTRLGSTERGDAG